MTRHQHPTDPELTQTLQSLDAAPQQPAAGLSPRAADDLQRILATDPLVAPAPTAAPVRSPWRRRAWLLPVAAAVGVGAVVVPNLLGGDPSAYASWSAKPTAPADGAAAGQACLDSWSVGRPTEAAEGMLPELDGLHLVLAEQRGDFTYVLLADDSGSTTMECLTSEETGMSSGQGVGAVSGSSEPVTLAPDAVSMDGILGSTTAGSYTSVSGRIGSDVTGVVAHTADGRDVTATISEGYWAAWWPSGQEGDVTLTLTLADGSTREVSDPESGIPGDDALPTGDIVTEVRTGASASGSDG